MQKRTRLTRKEARIKTSIALPLDLWKRAKFYATLEQRDPQDLIAAALDAYLKSNKTKLRQDFKPLIDLIKESER